MFNELKDLHPAAQVAAIVMGFALIGWLGYWFMCLLREPLETPNKPK